MSPTSSSWRTRLAQATDTRPPTAATPGSATRLATFVLLLAGGILALLFAARLVAAAFGCGFSPFVPALVPRGHAAQAGLLVVALLLLCALVWLVLRHDGETLWLATANGGTLVPSDAVTGPAGAAAAGAHPDVVRAEAHLRLHRGAFGGRVQVWARPLAAVAPIQAAVAAAVRGEVVRLTGRDLDAVDVRVKVLAVSQLKRYLA